MIFLWFSVLMLALFITSRFRSPEVSLIRAPWFIASLLPGELPWAFALIQSFASVILVVILVMQIDSFGPANLTALAISLITLVLWCDLHRKTFSAEVTFRAALDEGLGKNFSDYLRDDLCVTAPAVIDHRNWLKPFSYRRPGVERLIDIAYGSHPRQQLDIYRPSSPSPSTSVKSPEASARAKSLEKKISHPVLLHVHGGGWIVGNKRQQAQPLMQYLAQNGWVCVDINYRLAPAHPYPNCLIDVKTAIAWIKENIASFGGDPDFIAMTGESAGAHLSLLSALTPGLAQFQPGFEATDTSVQAIVSMYGVYDFTNSNNSWSGLGLDKLLHKSVMPFSRKADPALWRAASPKFQIHELAPPIFIIHGTHDCLVFVEEARDFVKLLRASSRAPVVYAELEGAQHGFDLFHSVRTEFSIEAAGKFFQYCYSQWRDKQKPRESL